MTDPRVEKLIVAIGGNPEFEAWRRVYTHQVEAFEAAGLTVIDATDPDAELANRIARALWDGKSERLPMHSAYKALAALAMPGDGAQETNDGV